MTDLQKEEIEFAHRLRNHPCLRVYFDEMLETADDAEDLVVAQIRKTGQEMLRVWAQGHIKKRSSGTPHSETSQLKNKDC